MYTPSGATNDKSFSMDPTKLSLVERFLAGCAKRSGAGSGVDESSGSPGSLLVASSRSRGLLPSRLAKAGEGPGCLAGKQTRMGATVVRKSERPLGTWISSSATVYTPSGATNDKSFSMDPTKFSLAMERFLAGCAKRSGARSGVDESSG